MINLFRIKNACTFTCPYLHSCSVSKIRLTPFYCIPYRKFHMICTKEILSWFPSCPRNAQRLGRAFVQEGEEPKCSREPRPAFGCSIHAHCQEPSHFSPAPGKQQVFGEATQLLSFPMVTRGTVPALLQPPWPASANALVLLSPSFAVKRVFAKGKSVLYHSRAWYHLCSDTRRAQSQPAFLGGTEEHGMLPAHSMSWYHLPARAEGKVTNVMLKKKFPFYY